LIFTYLGLERFGQESTKLDNFEKIGGQVGYEIGLCRLLFLSGNIATFGLIGLGLPR